MSEPSLCVLVNQTHSRGEEIRHFFARIAAETIVSSYFRSRINKEVTLT